MDNARRIEKWNTRWMIIAGRAVCSDRLESQALEDCEKPFSHAPVCESKGQQSDPSWVALHEILDCT
jgi:hypothetical protein